MPDINIICLLLVLEMTSSPQFEVFKKYDKKVFNKYTNQNDETIVLTSLHPGTLYRVTCKYIVPCLHIVCVLILLLTSIFLNAQ